MDYSSYGYGYFPSAPLMQSPATKHNPHFSVPVPVYSAPSTVPPSNNLNWICGVCGNLNYPYRTQCNKKTCGVRKEDAKPQYVLPSSMPPLSSQSVSSSSPSPSVSLPSTSIPSISPHLSNPNHLSSTLAVLSTLLRLNNTSTNSVVWDLNQSMKKRIRGPEDYNWTCPYCGNENWPTRTHCNLRKCGKERPESTRMWKCNECGNWNLPTRTICNIRKCKHPRELGQTCTALAADPSTSPSSASSSSSGSGRLRRDDGSPEYEEDQNTLPEEDEELGRASKVKKTEEN
eukprot:TRINITY_DN848_c0_g1_i3.p1 TRINITY_DN848_c0_g1~~TRINITY_DN848_c0_g1_i3.p1  ORF type:complete len:288 (-),score=51.60 TRINITY_DN848_c0_g1_i3:330-1193(-)